MGGSTRWTWTNISPTMGLWRWPGVWECGTSRAVGEESRESEGCRAPSAAPPRGQSSQAIEQLRPARARRRGVSHRPEMAHGPPAARRDQIRDLQRRRRRPGGVHGPHDPRIVPLPGHRRAGHRRGGGRRARGHLLHPPRVSAGGAAGEGGAGRVRAARLAGRAPAGQRLPAAHLDQGRRRRVRLRRGDGPDRVGGRPARDAAPAPAVPGAVRPVGQAHPHQQRRDAGPGAVDHPPRRRRRSPASGPRPAKARRCSPWPARSAGAG